MSAARRRYSEEEKAQALAIVDACGGGYKQAARETGIPWTTLREWHQGKGVNESVAEIRSNKRGALAARLEAKVDLLVDAIDTARIADAGLVPVTTALKTVMEKMLALEQAAAPTQEEVEAMQQRAREEMAAVIKRYVEDPNKLVALASELEALAAGDGQVGPAGSASDPAAGR